MKLITLVGQPSCGQSRALDFLLPVMIYKEYDPDGVIKKHRKMIYF